MIMNIISGLFGVGASLFVWWLTIKKLVPSIKFSEKICKTESKENQSGYKYQFSIENTGWRTAIDLDVYARLRVKKDDNERWMILYLPTDTLNNSKIAVLRKKTEKYLQTHIEIQAYKCDDFKNEFWENEINAKFKNGKLTLDDVMSCREETELEIMILATDKFSGSRKFFETKYHKKDIENETIKNENKMGKKVFFGIGVITLFTGLSAVGAGLGLLFDKLWEFILIGVGVGLLIESIVFLKNAKSKK